MHSGMITLKDINSFWRQSRTVLEAIYINVTFKGQLYKYGTHGTYASQIPRDIPQLDSIQW